MDVFNEFINFIFDTDDIGLVPLSKQKRTKKLTTGGMLFLKSHNWS